MEKTKPKKKISTGAVVAIGAGVAALGAVSYYFFGPHGKRHRKTFKGWMIKMKGEIIEKLENASEVTEAAYHGIIDSIANAYIRSGKGTEADVKRYADELKRQWKRIAAGAKKTKTVRPASTKKRTAKKG